MEIFIKILKEQTGLLQFKFSEIFFIHYIMKIYANEVK